MDQIAKRRGILLVSSSFFLDEEDGGNPIYFNPSLTQCDENGGLEGDAEQIKSNLDTLATFRISEDYENKLYWREQDEWSYGQSWQDAAYSLKCDNYSFRDNADGRDVTLNGI